MRIFQTQQKKPRPAFTDRGFIMCFGYDLVAAGRTSFAFLGLVDLQGAATELFAVQGLHGLEGVSVVHLDEAETAEAAGLTVVDELDGQDFAVLGENVAQVILRGAEGDVTDIDRLRHAIKLLKESSKKLSPITPEQIASGQRVQMSLTSSAQERSKALKPQNLKIFSAQAIFFSCLPRSPEFHYN